MRRRTRARSERLQLTLFVAGSLALLVACSRADSDTPREPLQLGAIPGAPKPLASAVSSATTSTNGMTTATPSFWGSDSDAGSGRPGGQLTTSLVTVTTTSVEAPRDPDAPAVASLRMRLNGCFPLANLAPGTTRNVSLALRVLSTGRVSSYDLSGVTTADGRFYDCVRGVADTATFPERSTTRTDGGPPPVDDIRTVDVTAGATAS